ncbi:MAG: hypothetical protein H6707_15815 [Deltaproteobacteria bacterium]|nr:hypothetical protein [Deltaproteobacteria bacterium]
MSSRARKILCGALMTLGFAALVGCNTPQIPLPPPLIDAIRLSVVDATQHLVVIEGKADTVTGRAIVRVRNQSTGFGVFAPANSDGSFVTGPLVAADGARLLIDYELDAEPSEVLCVVANYTSELGVSSCKD